MSREGPQPNPFAPVKPSNNWLRRLLRRAVAGLKLPLKTTIILLVLLIAIVALCGGIFDISTRTMLQRNKAAQVSQFAYAVAAVLEQKQTDLSDWQSKLNSLRKTPDLQFAVLTDANLNTIADFIPERTPWQQFTREFAGQYRIFTTQMGQARELFYNGLSCYVVSVPVFRVDSNGRETDVIGYLHVGISGAGDAAQLRFVQAFILLTCMAVVLIAVPIAGLIARHITVPIQRLAAAAHALAGGDLAHRVNLPRADELGELALAFNRMADTVQQQQEDIKQINAGLEQTVQRRTAELEKLNARLQAEMLEKEDFLRAVSHDLNAPLRNIAGMASMLILKYQNTLEKDALQRLERIQKNVDVECELINELLELSRIKTRREKIERVDLGELLDAVADNFSSDFETRRIEFRREGHFPVMQCEKSRLRQVFQNLIDNGVKYMRDDSEREIVVSVIAFADEFTFTVKDTGIGISKEDLPQLFHVFRRAKNASMMKIPGKGVGLASVKSIIDNYSGRLWVESIQGKGTTFHFAIPRSHFPEPSEVTV
ncbi:MAG TPA: HAMP domain-containing sensor histidine kinase [Phycisphaerae bacterium]|nr:HAMP domain-containing sensor histidine kinase [Phycisphaerae bacterium]